MLLFVRAVVKCKSSVIIARHLSSIFRVISTEKRVFRRGSFLRLTAITGRNVRKRNVRRPTFNASFLGTISVFGMVAMSITATSTSFGRFLSKVRIVSGNATERFHSFTRV